MRARFLDSDGLDLGSVFLDENGIAQVDGTEKLRLLLTMTAVVLPDEESETTDEVFPEDGRDYIAALPSQFRGSLVFARLEELE